MRVGSRAFSQSILRLRYHRFQRAALQLVDFGQHDLIGDCGLVQIGQHGQIICLQAVAAVHQHKYAAQIGAALQIGIKQPVPGGDF